MNTFLMWLGGLLIAVLALLFAGPHFVDWNSYRGVFEEEASRLLGRRVRVGGNVNVRLLPAPYVLFENLRIADTTGLAGQPLFKTDSFKMWLAVPPLLKGAFEANKVELDNPVLALASDREGYGNWRSLMDLKSLPFVPSGVKLDSVTINNGTLIYALEEGGELTRVESISGELTAQALEGPYTFLGEAAVGGRKSELRLATTEAGENGSFRLTSRIRSPERKSEHRFDGQVRDFLVRPSVSGELISRFALETPDPGGRDSARQPAPPLLAEVRTQAKADASALKLEGLTISFDQFDQPQIITGELTAHWARRHKVELVLGSRWLDIDLLLDRAADPAAAQDEAGGEQKAGVVPLPTARRLVASLLDVFPGQTDVSSLLEIDQVNFGRDRVSGLVIAMERTGGALRLQTLRAVLPGGARLNFSGQVEAFEGEPVFDGELFLGGVSAARVIQWGVADSELKSTISDGPFSVAGRMRLGTKRVMLRQATAEFSGLPVRGSLVWDDAEKPMLQIDAEGYEIDTRWFGLGKLDMPAALSLFSGPAESSENNNAQTDRSPRDFLPGWLSKDDRALQLDLRAGRLVDGETTLSEVNAKLEIKSGRMDVERLALTTAEGLRVDVDGEVDVSGKRPKGRVNYLVAAEDRTAAWQLAEAVSGSKTSPDDRDRIAALAPIRLAGRAALGQRQPEAADFIFNGTALGGRVEGRVELDGGLSGWSVKPVDLIVRSDVPDVAEIMASLGGPKVRRPAKAEAQENAAGTLLLKAAGIPQTGLLALATVESRPVGLVFDGKARFEGRTFAAVEGELQLKASDSSGLLAAAGIDLPGSFGNVPFDGLADVTWKPGRLDLSPRDALFAGSRVAGRFSLSEEDGIAAIDARLKTDRIDLATLLGGLLSGGQSTAAVASPTRVAAANVSGEVRADASPEQLAPTVFSDRAFDFSPLQNVKGEINVETGTLILHDGWEVAGAHAVFRLSPGSLSVGIDKAKALGGDFTAELALQKKPAGASVEGNVALSGIELGRFPLDRSIPAPPLGSGQADLKLGFKGSGLTPRGLIPVTSGSGTLTLRNAQIAALTPLEVRRAAEEALTGDEIDGSALRATLAATAGNERLPLGKETAELSIVDGGIRLTPIDVKLGELDKARMTATLDLGSLVLDSDWQVVATDPKGGRAWPPVSVVRVGPLAKLGAMESQFTTDALERELAVRKMERNVKELERLRKLDEEAAARQRERERQRELESQRIEAERAAAAAAAAAARGEAPPRAPGANSPARDGWAPEPQPAERPQGSPGPQGSTALPTDGATDGLPTTTLQPPPQTRKTRPRPRRKAQPKPKSLTKQIFGFE